MKINSFNQEFGYELLSSIPYSYELYLQNKLTETESGEDTESLYYFSPKHKSNSIKRTIKNTNKAKKEKLPYIGIHTHERPDLKFPPYKSHFKNKDYKWDKPTLCICNRYTTEWNNEPVNYFDLEILDWMFSNLKDLYHIVYFPVNIPPEFEDQEQIRNMDDIDIALKHNVNVFTHIKGKSWNESMLKVFANCEHYITMNGGYSILASLFGGTNIIYSKKCNELHFKSFWRWYPNHSDQRCLHIDNYLDLKERISELYIKKSPLVNVIINMSNPILFKRCIKSVLKQDYKNINVVVVTNDEKNIKYTRKYNFRHIHINPLMHIKNENYEKDFIKNVNIDIVQEKVKGFIVVLDDTDIFLCKDSLSSVMKSVDKNKLLIWKTQMPGKIIPKNKKNFKFHNNICYHTKHIKLANWKPNKKSLNILIKNFRKKLKIKCIDEVINKFDDKYDSYDAKIFELYDKSNLSFDKKIDELVKKMNTETFDTFDNFTFDDKIDELIFSHDEITKSKFELIINKNLKYIPKSNSEIAVLLHLYYTDLLPEFISYLKNIKQDYDLYITLVKGTNDLDKTIKEIFNFKEDANILLVENKGLDIGGTFMIMKKIIEDKKSYKYYLKLQTKKSLLAPDNYGETWRKDLCKICDSELNVHNSLNLLKLYNVGMIGNKKNICDSNGLYNNIHIVNQYAKKFKLNLDNLEFIGGTMFWVKGDIWENFFKSINIDLEYSKFCNGSFTDSKHGTYTHSMERIFGIIIKSNKLKIIGI